MQALAFSGIHVISPRIFEKITEEGAFSIIDSVCAAGDARREDHRLSERMSIFGVIWGGRKMSEQAARDLESGIFSW